MTKFWQVLRHEYTRHVFQRRFLFALLSVPFLILVMIGMIFLMVGMETDTTPMGYVDYSGILSHGRTAPPPEPPERPVPMQAFESEQAAETALQAGEIQAYYIIPEDYTTSGKAELVYIKEPRYAARGQFYDLLLANLMADQPPEIANRIIEGNEIIVRAADASQEVSENDFFAVLMPIFTGIIFIVAIATTSGYLLQAVVEEKENRTMEIMVTSVSPTQLMAGKILGDIAIGLTQLVVWSIFIALGILIGRDHLEFLQGVQIPIGQLALAAGLMIPAFIMNAAFMAAVGATVTEAREGQQVSGLFMLPIWIPYMLIALIMESPNSPIVVAMSLFPLTAPLTMILRAGFTTVPAWQIIASIGLLSLTALGALWLAGRAFRLGMLRYGQRLRWKEVFAREGAKA